MKSYLTCKQVVKEFKKNNKHFFFKFKQGNSGFNEFKESKDFNENKVPLPIYFGPWTIEQYLNDQESIDFGNSHQKEHRISQVKLFFKLRNFNDNIYFWIFLTDKIYAIKLNLPYEVFQIQENQPTYLVDSEKDGSIPKLFYGKIVKQISKNSLPESFANINSNQKYNRKTIAELVDIEREIADNLIENGEKLSISRKDIFMYLSPIQFETLIFLIFVENRIYCSTYRGGTKEKYDLTIDNDIEIFPEFKMDGMLNIQIKMKTEYKPEQSNENTIHIYLGENVEEINLFGKDWILLKISESKYIKQWLEKSLIYFSIKD